MGKNCSDVPWLEDEMYASEELHASSFESFEDAAVKAMGEQQENREMFDVLLAIERGGVVGRVQYHATLTPREAPPSES
jgi:hypothetical protein